jgi:hypothetical protein
MPVLVYSGLMCTFKKQLYFEPFHHNGLCGFRKMCLSCLTFVEQPDSLTKVVSIPHVDYHFTAKLSSVRHHLVTYKGVKNERKTLPC